MNEMTPIVAMSLPLSLILFQFTIPKTLDWVFRIKIPVNLLVVLRFALFFPIAMLTIFDWTAFVEGIDIFGTLHLLLSKLLSLPLVEYLAFFCDIGVSGYTFFGLISSDANRYRDQPFYWQYRKAMHRYALTLSIVLVIMLLTIFNLRALVATVAQVYAVQYASTNKITFVAITVPLMLSTMGMGLLLQMATRNSNREIKQIRTITVIEDGAFIRNPRWLGILVCAFMIAYQSILSKAIWMIVVLNFVVRIAIRVFRKDTVKKKTRFSMETILDSWWNADRIGRFAFLILISTWLTFTMQWITKSPLPTGGSVYISENIITILNVMDVFLILLLVSISRKKLLFTIVLPFHVFVRYISPIMFPGLYLSTSYGVGVTSFLAEATSLNLFPILLYLVMDIALLAYNLSFDSYSRSLQKLIKDRRDNIDLLKKTLKFAKLVEIVRYLQWISIVVWFNIFMPLASNRIIPLDAGGVIPRHKLLEFASGFIGLFVLIMTGSIYYRGFKNGEDCLSETFNEVNERLHEGILSQNSKVVLRTSCLNTKAGTRSYSYLIIYLLVLFTTTVFGMYSAQGIISIRDRYLRSLDESQLKQPIMDVVSGGTFLMGSDMDPYSSPIHEVIITYDFYLTIKSITFAEYVSFCDSTGRKEPMMYALERQNAAVVGINWYDAIAYCNWLSNNEGLPKAYDKQGNLLDVYGNSTSDPSKVFGYRLPTEAEWEYAAKRSFLNKEDNSADCLSLGSEIIEWCSDWYDRGYYRRSPILNPYNSISDSYRVIRNTGYKECSFMYDIARRIGKLPSSEYANLSFSVCRTCPEM